MRLSGFYLPVERLSATSLAEAITCPEQFRLKRIKKLPERNNIAKLLGTAFHEGIADNYRWKMEHGFDLPDTAVLGRFNGAWDSAIEKEGEPEWKEHPDKVKETGHGMLNLYMKKVAPGITPLKVEQWFEESVPGIPVPLVGVIDLEVSDRIKETKTSASKLKKPKPNWRLQGRIYQLMVDKPVEHVIVTKQVTPQIVTASEEPGLLTPVQNRDVTVKILQQAAAMVNDLYARYGPDEPWPAHGTFHDWLCSYCSHKPNCFAWKETYGQEAA